VISMVDCPHCDKSFDSESSMLAHHASHEESLPKPDDVDLPEDKNWEDLTSRQRHYYKNREERKENRKEHRKDRQEWFQNFKSQFSCVHCDESRNPTIHFHHVEKTNKDVRVGQMASKGYAKETIKNEVDKTVPLCANCHALLHAGYDEVQKSVAGAWKQQV